MTPRDELELPAAPRSEVKSQIATHDVRLEDLAALDPSKVLFIGMGRSAVAWYRCFLPAMFMGADWAGLAGDPDDRIAFLTGMVKRDTKMPDFRDYDVIVMQQPRGRGWLKVIRRLQERGTKVIFEVDDYLHAIRKMGDDHDYSEHFDRDALKDLELNMRVCDAMVVSTEYIARRYASFNKRVYICRNGVDMGRYNLTRPPRATVNIGWAGGTGHVKGVMPWLTQVAWVMQQRDHTTFVSIGQNFASGFHAHFPEERAIGIPFTMIDTYPSAMTMLDVAIAPAGRNAFFRGKSDLRWVEAGALGIPIIADPVVYPDIEHGVNGFHAENPVEMTERLLELVDDEKLRLEMGEAARSYVREERDMRKAVRQWEWAISDVLAQ